MISFATKSSAFLRHLEIIYDMLYFMSLSPIGSFKEITNNESAKKNLEGRIVLAVHQKDTRYKKCQITRKGSVTLSQIHLTVSRKFPPKFERLTLILILNCLSSAFQKHPI